jgi:hypothetical protein
MIPSMQMKFQQKGPSHLKPSQEGPPTSSNNKFEFLENLEETTNRENTKKEVEEE